jgi:hypothetical protein
VTDANGGQLFSLSHSSKDPSASHRLKVTYPTLAIFAAVFVEQSSGMIHLPFLVMHTLSRDLEEYKPGSDIGKGFAANARICPNGQSLSGFCTECDELYVFRTSFFHKMCTALWHGNFRYFLSILVWCWRTVNQAEDNAMGQPERVYFSPSAIATRWDCSTDKVSRILEAYRGNTGFMDLGSPESVRARKRRYSIIRIHPDLLARIEVERCSRVWKRLTTIVPSQIRNDPCAKLCTENG